VLSGYVLISVSTKCGEWVVYPERVTYSDLLMEFRAKDDQRGQWWDKKLTDWRADLKPRLNTCYDCTMLLLTPGGCLHGSQLVLS